MPYINVEIKARTHRSAAIHEFLMEQGAEFVGTDIQKDTYFHVPEGRLKLREGAIENNLIFYMRADVAGPRSSAFDLAPVPDPDGMLQVLSKALGVKVTVVKKRSIYYLANVKFHLDEIEGLGSFVEIEAGNKRVDLPLETLQEQCDYYIRAFEIAKEDFIQVSYSDMLLSRLNAE